MHRSAALRVCPGALSRYLVEGAGHCASCHSPLNLIGGEKSSQLYNGDTAEQAIAEGRADLIAFGRPFIANPDLPARLQGRTELNPADGASFFGGDAKGYIDYPALA